MRSGESRGPFVGRVAELDALRALTSSAGVRGPAGGVVFGKPGIGKSRLLDELVGTLDWPLVRLQGYLTTRKTALGAAGGLIRELARSPEVGERLDALVMGTAGRTLAREQFRLFEVAFRCLLGIGPLGIVTDDLQWMDRQTLSLLLYLVTAARTTGPPLLVVCASRPSRESVAFAADLAAALPPRQFTQIDLLPLDERDGLCMLGALAPGLARDRAGELWRRAAGSPFWMAALAGDLATREGRHVFPHDAVPPSLPDLILSRCTSLAPAPASLFALLLVAAQPLRIEDVCQVLGWPDDRVVGAASELVNRALVLHDGATLTVAHDLIRETAATDVSEHERQRMNQRLAEWLEASAGDDLGLLSQALHHRASSGSDAYELALRIARSPQRRLLGTDGLAILGDVADSRRGADRRALQMEVATLAFEIGEWLTAFERWSVLADRAVAGPERATAALAAAAAALKLGRPFEVHSFAARARALADDGSLVSIEADCLDAQSLLWLEGRVGDAQPVVDTAVAASERLVARAGGIARLSDPESAAYVSALRARLDAAIRQADAGTVHYCAELIQQTARDPADVLAAVSDGVYSLLQFEGLPRPAEPRAKRALEECRRLTMPGLEVEFTHWAGWIAHHLGRLDEASDLMNQAVALAERVGAPRRFTIPQLRAVLHGVEASRTDWRSNLESIERVLASEPDPHFRLVIRSIQLGLVGRFSPPDQAALDALIAATASDAQVAGCGRCLWESVLQGAEASARTGSTAAAEDALRRWDAAHPDPPPGGPAVRRAHAEALVAAGRDPEASLALFAGAASAADEIGYRLMRLWIEIDAAAALVKVDRALAVETLARVAREAEEIGARSELLLATARLRGLGVRVWRRSSTSSAAALSGREREIAEAVARGASNPEIAGSLFLSRKTVERHVSHILAKLGARNRAELAAMLARED